MCAVDKDVRVCIRISTNEQHGAGIVIIVRETIGFALALKVLDDFASIWTNSLTTYKSASSVHALSMNF